jgi:large subunit ribosomal protein L30
MTETTTKPRAPRKRAEKAAEAPQYVRITLVRSLVGYPGSQRLVARGLGLRKLQSHVVRPASPEILGMVRKISHVLKVEATEKP